MYTIKKTETVKYSDLYAGDVIIWYGAIVRIVDVSRTFRKCGNTYKPCTYFTIEPYNEKAVEILGNVRAYGQYGGVDKLTVQRLEKAFDNTDIITNGGY